MTKTYPKHRQTKLEPISRDEALVLAHEHYDNAEIESSYYRPGTFEVRSLSGYVACVGKVNGQKAILHKIHGGNLELNVY